MARVIRRYALPYCLLLIGAICLAGGCSMLSTLLYVTGGGNIKAEYKGLSEKKVAVVCRPLATLQFRNAGAARDVAKKVGQLLEENGKKITVIDQRQIGEWADENDWEDFTEIGDAVDADMVIGIDLEQFSINEEQTLLQGRADVRITVYDMRDGEKEVFEKALPQCLFPSNSPVASADKAEHEFYAQFVGVLSSQIARTFYDHEPHMDFASDSNVLR